MKSFLFVLLSAKLGFAAKVLAQKPQMGWNSWNSFKLNVSDELVRSTTDAFINTGLAKLGYDHVLIDDGWQDSERDSDGKLAANHTRFPGGISATAAYVHSKGLKVGIYSDAGIFTCGKYPGSYGYEEVDAQTFADWGVDYLKYDNCGGFQSNTLSVQERFLKMSYALAASSRQIFYSLCEWGNQFPWLWADQIGESYRMSGDIYSSFAKDRATCSDDDTQDERNQPVLETRLLGRHGYAGDWNLDHDGAGRANPLLLLGCSQVSPNLIGANLQNISDTSLAIYKNKEIIALNQDDAGKPAVYLRKLSEEGSYQVWAGPLSSGKSRHVILVQNYGSSDTDVEIPLGEIPGLSVKQQLKIRDVWAGKSITASGGKVSLKSIKPIQTKVLVISR
ncbi:alpha-galactosidase [Fusarium coicis]|nr:alpha-galactosidase [Fusarium coicis]